MCVAPIPLKQESVKFAAQKPFGLGKSNIINVPCGRCIECRKNYVNGWVFRIMNQFKCATTETSWFITMTYDDKSLYDLDNGLITAEGEYSLNYRHFQLFMKKLRKSYEKTEFKSRKIKYFAVGEYGDRSDRPHFHAIVFNADQQNIIDAWEYGSVHFGDVKENSVGYTLKYAFKRVKRVHKTDHKEVNPSRAPEKALISQGIGLSYLTPEKIKFYQNDLEKQLVKDGGREQAIPRYYRNKIYTQAQLDARSRVIQKAMADQFSPEDLRERQALAKKAFSDSQKKEAKRKRTGY